MEGYWNAPEETARALRDGWLHTGDIGSVDNEGYTFLVDRKKEMISAGRSASRLPSSRRRCSNILTLWIAASSAFPIPTPAKCPTLSSWCERDDAR